METKKLPVRVEFYLSKLDKKKLDQQAQKMDMTASQLLRTLVRSI